MQSEASAVETGSNRNAAVLKGPLTLCHYTPSAARHQVRYMYRTSLVILRILSSCMYSYVHD